MALKVLLLRKKRDDLTRALEGLLEKQAGYSARETELETAINELPDDAPEEDRAVVEQAVSDFETEREETEGAISSVTEQINELEAEISELEQRSAQAPSAESRDTGAEPRNETRGDEVMSRRNVFRGMSAQERTALMQREDVQTFLGRVRITIRERRAIGNAGLTIPDVFLGIIRENIMDYSKLIRHVNLRQINGDGRMVVMGTIPEAIWTDCCGSINELELVFNDVEVQCWKVGGYFDICNATIEDSDLNLASEILTVLGQAIGMAADKAMMFGLGTRMPLGIFTRLAQTSAPADYPATARPWVDLHTTNIKTIADTVTGVDLFRQFLLYTSAAKGKYSRGEKVWVMNEATHTALIAAAMSIDASGAIVSSVNGTMPVIGGAIEVLDFVPDNMIIGGYLDLYLLAERSGTRLEQSEHVRFLQDRTVFRGTARYDGAPVIAEGFVAIGINGVTPSAAGISFAPDTANTVQSIILNHPAVSVAAGASVQLVATTLPVKGEVTWTSGTEAKATVDATGKVTGVEAGTSVITATCGDATATCTVTVTSS